MKKSIVALMSTTLIAAAVFTSCGSSEEKVNDAQEEVGEAKEELAEAKDDYSADAQIRLQLSIQKG